MTRTNAVLADAPKAADDAKLLLEQLHRLERASVIGSLDFETRMDIAYELGDVLDRLNAYRVRVLG